MGHQSKLEVVASDTARCLMMMIFMIYGLVALSDWIAKFPILLVSRDKVRI